MKKKFGLKVLLGSILFLFIASMVFAVGRCVPCKLNHYCIDGLRYQCPANAPVTQWTGTDSLDGCLTCIQRNGNSANPIYDDLVGDCVSCYEYDSSTPIWDGNTCVACGADTPMWNGSSCEACPNETEWNSTQGKCISTLPCAYNVPHGDKTICLVESVGYSDFEELSPKSAAEETEEFCRKYGIANPIAVEYPDAWAGAMKYCQDKGLRLPTVEELISIANAVYTPSYICTDECNNINYEYVGAQTGCCLGTVISVSTQNSELWNWITSGTIENGNSNKSIYSNAESDTDAIIWLPITKNLHVWSSSHEGISSKRALCIK